MQKIAVNKKIVGHFDESTKIFTESVVPNKHYYRKSNSYGKSEYVLNSLKNRDCTLIKIVETEGKKRVLISKLNDWFKYGKKIQHTGFELQIHLPLSYMQDISNIKNSLF